jgi:hypothetical protein
LPYPLTFILNFACFEKDGLVTACSRVGAGAVSKFLPGAASKCGSATLYTGTGTVVKTDV